jgi:response regulator RpfG family c-di-GMP phosphodiesterase/DNA-binding SARP family transcriptional activator
MEHILLVEDDELMRLSLQAALVDAGYRVTAVEHGLAAVEAANETVYEVVLCDVRMPGMSGLEALSRIRAAQPEVRSIVITGYASAEAPIEAVKLRVDDYMMKPFSAEAIVDSVRQALERRRQEVGGARFREDLMKLVTGVVFESRIPHHAGHAERVAQSCLRLARDLGLSPQRTQALYLATLLHDIGQAELPPHLFEKREWSEADVELMRSHPLLSVKRLEPFDALRDIATFVLHHHERWDGGGYPRGLAGEQIPLESRILAVAEAFESLQSDRPYRARHSRQRALDMLESEAGRAFDPTLVERLVRLMKNGADQAEAFDAEPVSVASEQRLDVLLGLADAYRASGQLDVAERAYAQAEGLLRPETPIESERRLREGQLELLMGRLPRSGVTAFPLQLSQSCDKKAVTPGDGSEQLRHSARTHLQAWLASLDGRNHQLEAARVRLRLAALELEAGELASVERMLSEATVVFDVWESSHDLALCHLLSCQLWRRRGDGAAFDLHGRALAAALPRHGELWNEQPAALAEVIAEALARGVWQGTNGRDPRALAIYEQLLASGDRNVRMRVIDLLADWPHRAAQGLLTRARQSDDAGVGLKSVAARTAGRLDIHFLGPLRVLVDGQPIDDNAWVTRKIRSVFAFLASRRGHAVSLETLMEALWDDDGRAEHSVRNSVSQIRATLAKRLGEGARSCLQKRPEGYVFRPTFDCWIDVEAFDEHCTHGAALASQGRWDDAVVELSAAERLYGGDFLQYTSEPWCDEMRLRLRNKFIEGLQTLAEYFLRKDKWAVSLEYWTKILARDNCNEDAYLGAIDCHMALGEPHKAMKLYQAAGQAFKKELDMTVPPRLMKAYLRLTG